jgi:hypothetical protein
VRLAIGCLGVLGPAAAAVAQPAGDEWRVTVAPYLMAAGMSGTAGIGRLETDVEVSASDIFSNLQFGAQGYFEVMKGDWGFGADVIWMALGTSIDRPPTNIDVNQGAFTFLALRRLSPIATLRAGILVNTIQPTIKFKDPIDRELSGDATWVDPVVGINLHTPGEGRWGVALVADIGGFGLGSDFMFDVMPTVRVGLTRSADVAFGYRWISLDYEKDGDDDRRRILYDVTSSGPFAGFIFRF